MKSRQNHQYLTNYFGLTYTYYVSSKKRHKKSISFVKFAFSSPFTPPFPFLDMTLFFFPILIRLHESIDGPMAKEEVAIIVLLLRSDSGGDSRNTTSTPRPDLSVCACSMDSFLLIG